MTLDEIRSWQKIKDIKYTDIIAVELFDKLSNVVFEVGLSIYKQVLSGKMSGISSLPSHKNPERRKATIKKDSIKGQAGELLLSMLMFGSEEGFNKYLIRRNIINQNPTKGDGGSDVEGYLIDIKTSECCKSIYGYHLLVRNEEKDENKDDHIYVHALIKAGEMTRNKIRINITGWSRKKDLSIDPFEEGQCHEDLIGAYFIPVGSLKPMSTFPYEKKLEDCKAYQINNFKP